MRHVVLDLRGATAREAIGEIVERLRESGDLRESEKFFDAVMEREEKSSTVAEGGVAFPHARTNLVDQLVLGIGRSKTGVLFPGGEDLVHLIFLIAVPQQMVNDYLICIGALARVLKKEETRQRLLQASTPEAFIDALRNSE